MSSRNSGGQKGDSRKGLGHADEGALAAARKRNLRIVAAALAMLASVLFLVARRDGVGRVVPDLWASARLIVHMVTASDWPFG